MENRVVVITGATGGLGRAAARAFADRGASLALVSTNQEKLDSMAAELDLPSDRILAHAADLLDPKAVRDSAEAVSAKFGRVDALIHLVGGWTGGKTLVESGTDDYKFMLDQHAWTTIHLLQSFIPKLEENGWGRVVAVSSPFATNPISKRGPYSVGKAAQDTLLLAMAAEHKGTAITANIIQVHTIDMEDKGIGATPNEIIAAMFYLCSDAAAKINGFRLQLYA